MYLDDHDAVVLGHTHVQHKLVSDVGVVNPESVGQPRDGVAAKYAIVDTETSTVELRATGYDVIDTVTDIRRSRLPDSTAERLVPQCGNAAHRTRGRGAKR